MKNNVNSNNAFVKSQQARMSGMMGDRPGVKADGKKFNANMSNDGNATEAFARKVTSGLDKSAFPVK